MRLDIWQRLIILSVLPNEGNLIEIKILRKLKERLSFLEDEIKECNIKIEGEKYLWDITKDRKSNFDFTEIETKLIVTGLSLLLKELDDHGKITEQHLLLFELFNL